jgi:hypothetical protein
MVRGVPLFLPGTLAMQNKCGVANGRVDLK